jgi:hypothetical protein
MQTTFDGPSRSYSIGIGSYPPLIKAYSLKNSQLRQSVYDTDIKCIHADNK